MSVSLLNQLGTWPENCVEQQAFIQQLSASLGNLIQDIEDQQSSLVTISQPSEPSQAQWETQWVLQTGNPLPIPSSAVLLWWDTLNSAFGGYFGTTAGEVTVRRREHRAPIGSTVILTQAWKNDGQSIVTGIPNNNSKMPSLTLTLLQKTSLILEFHMAVSPAATPTAYGTDFMINGVKIGTSVYGIPPDYGMVNQDERRIIYNQYIAADLLAGTYTIEVMFGLTGTAVGTLNVGGSTHGIRRLQARGIAVA